MRLNARCLAATAAIALSACTATSSPSDPGTATAAAPSTLASPPAPSASMAAPSVTAGATGVARSPWEGAGTMVWPRSSPTAVLLGDGRVLVLGDEGGKYEGVPEWSRYAELWDPGSGAWQETAYLDKARGQFAAATLLDGRALVAGGVNDDWYSFSSSYVFDPTSEAWTKTGLMTVARAHPAVAVLRDGRVLVAGGAYYSGVPSEGRSGIARLASLGGPLADLWPGPTTRALATAEVFDPDTGTWSRTGSMRYARLAPTAVTLGDGRVLVMGADDGSYAAPEAGTTPEIYDPATGTFDVGELLPAMDPATLDRIGVPREVRDSAGQATGSDGILVSSGDDAILVGSRWSGPAVDGVRTLRFSATSGQWSESGDPYLWWCSGSGDENEECPFAEAGVAHPDGIFAALPDGRVLAAGGFGPDGLGKRDAEVLDPASGRWSMVEPMPGARVAAATVVMADGRVLVAGGYSNPSDGYPIALADAFIFDPAP